MTASAIWRSIPHLLEDAVERHGTALAVVEGDLRLSYAGLGEQVQRAARGLRAHGVQPGDRVAIWAPNGWRWIVAALATQSLGAAIVPLNTRFRADEAGYIVGRARPKVVFVHRHFLDTDYEAMLTQGCTGLQYEVVSLDDVPLDKGISWSQLVADGESVSPEEVTAIARAVKADDVCDVMFTSGTTGHPKGVVGRHGQVLRAFHDFGRLGGFRQGDRLMLVNPFFHALGYKLGWLLSILMGAVTYPMAVFDPKQVLSLVERERITILPGPPTIYFALLAEPGLSQTDLSSLRACVTGSTTLPPALIDRIRVTFGFETMLTGYGLTECSGLATMTRPGDETRILCETSGRAIPDCEVAIFSTDGRQLPAGESGEIRVRGYVVMDSYFEDPEATTSTLTPDGWLLTGDLGSLDEQGNLRIVGRLKDMYIAGGFNAYPAEIENMLLQHEDVAEVSVIGIPDERLGEVGLAFVVRRAAADPTEADLIEWARGRMANYKVPRVVRFVDELPKNGSGKVLKTRLREIAAEH
ncbi:FadD3 family acyl-CoA ligase [Variovorax sp. PBL-E5]|uniref:FadD3 family acyl-CoA ligase n=1 Tax=Variovorax sp. PBL-E5 TaxID=434014 RepID=UPI0013178E86|nr:FadD3 family acyl-CoA ligase [Variovorax sp. PBL-E5]VTU46042.1 Long-chain-fatty-acid--CoA ligase [Variovorax sp. PBL-E5]